MNEMILIFIVGWFGSVWWPGIEVDAPPKGGGDWWWKGLALGVVGGISAILVARLVNIEMEAMAGLAVSIAAGRVGAGIVGAFMSMGRRSM
jgi:hypothetical protein